MRSGVWMQTVGVRSARPLGHMGPVSRWGPLPHPAAARASTSGLQHSFQVYHHVSWSLELGQPAFNMMGATKYFFARLLTVLEISFAILICKYFSSSSFFSARQKSKDKILPGRAFTNEFFFEA